MATGSGYASSASLRARASTPGRSAKVQFAFARIGMALDQRRGPREDASRADANPEGPSAVDALLGERLCRTSVG